MSELEGLRTEISELDRRLLELLNRRLELVASFRDYKDAAGEKRVGPGCFLRVPGGMKHWSGGDPKEGALFYEESSGKFDSIPVTKIISSPN